MRTMSARKFWLFINGLGMATFVVIGGLQAYQVNAGFLTNYGADLLLPPVLYFWFRRGTSSGHLRRGPHTSLLVVLAGCFGWEWSQRYDLGGTPLAIAGGTFDPLDLIAYATGVLVCYFIDIHWLQRGILATPYRRQKSVTPTC